MPNIILGTQSSGRLGKNIEDSIISVQHFGSTVYLAWPKQNDDANLMGYGDYSSGQKSGKLTTDWDFGEYFDVSKDNHDHLRLNCYVLKQQSGTQDSILVRIETKPLKSSPSVTEQAKEYEISGNYVEAISRDVIERKDIDYGDLTIKEISWPINVPLKNVKEVRVAAKHKNGQSADANKNLIIWGRLIKSTEET